MKFFLFFFLTVFVIESFGQTIIYDNNAEVRNVLPFSGIKVSGGVDVYLSQSDEYALAVSASGNKYQDAIRTEVSDGILTISSGGGTFRLTGNRKLRVYVSFQNLESIEASGASDLIINGIFKTNSGKIELAGASEIKGTIRFENLALNISGASTAKINGSVTNMKITASGASDVKNYELTVDNCIAELSGASDVRMTINKSLSATASGASTLYYKGSPQRSDINATGASNISQRPTP